MELGLIIYGSIDTVTGGYIYDKKLADFLRQKGERVKIISLPWRNYCHHLTDNFCSQLYRRLSQHSFDLVLQDELNHPSLFWVNQRLKKRLNYPIVSIIHLLRCSDKYPLWQNGFYRQIEKQYLKSVDGFIFNSENSQTLVKQLIGEARKAIVAYPGKDHIDVTLSINEITARIQHRGPLQILFLGNVIQRKGLHILLKALSIVPSDNWNLSVVGSLKMESTYVKTIYRQIEHDRLGERVSLLGIRTGTDLMSCLRQSHIMVVPSFFEGFGMVYVEGMGFGLPAIATTAGAAREIVTHEKNGYLITPGDFKTIAQYIQKLIKDRELLLKLSLAARQSYDDHPTWEQTCTTIHYFLQEFIR